MLDNRCVVQFLHPGGEPDVRAPGEWPWNTGKLHKRKFLVLPGQYRRTIDGQNEHSKRLALWGEWEPHSTVRRAAPSADDGPIWMHEPFYSPLPSGQRAQNTDPFVFGEQFHFTGCQQHAQGRPTQLARLLPGSLILYAGLMLGVHADLPFRAAGAEVEAVRC